MFDYQMMSLPVPFDSSSLLAAYSIPYILAWFQNPNSDQGQVTTPVPDAAWVHDQSV